MPPGHFEQPIIIPQMTFSAPRLYLANGVTTMRTTGSVEPYTDLNLKREIDAGHLVGPHLDVTSPYLEGPGAFFIQSHQITSPDDARKEVAFWADKGVDSFKAYMHLTRAELGAAIKEAHRHHLKLTGHLCSVTYPEAVALGIDNLEHGFFVNTAARSRQAAGQVHRHGRDADPAEDGTRQPRGECADQAAGRTPCRADLDAAGVRAKRAAARAAAGAADGCADAGGEGSLSVLAEPGASRAGTPRANDFTQAYKNDLGLERQFVAAGGLLMAGPDPTGNGGVIPGFGDQRELELLVEAGFTPVEAIRIATLNGATYLGLADRIGSIAPGKNADLFIVKGNPAANINDVENVIVVFKDGVGYDSAKLIRSVRGRFGEY